MAAVIVPYVLLASAAGVVGGLGLLVRGMQGYRSATRIGDVATSRIASLAAGEARISGIVEPAEVVLVSPLQSTRCVYYRTRVRQSTRNDVRTLLREERAVGFRVRDGSGDIRVFPRGAAWDVPNCFDDHDGAVGDRPPGLDLRTGPAVELGQPDRETQIAQLLGTGQPGHDPGLLSLGLADPLSQLAAGGRRDYEEARLEAGQAVTIVGAVLPFSALGDPDEADIAIGADEGLAPGELDPEVAADLAEARETGELAADSEAAWGNAAIPGFGIGRPVRPPVLDPGAIPPPLAAAPDAERFRRTFEIAPESLVIAAGPDSPLLISLGEPALAEARNERRFLVGLLGAVLAIISAVAVALQLGGGLP
ncbi:MAG TPA: hypothetical protein VIV06_10120 [Candidatus Limnocylindrales bacterium]